MQTTTRLMVNSTIGLLGFINVASDVPRKAGLRPDAGLLGGSRRPLSGIADTGPL